MGGCRRSAGPIPVPVLLLRAPLVLLAWLDLPGTLLLPAVLPGLILSAGLVRSAGPVRSAGLAWRARLGRGPDGNGRAGLACGPCRTR